MGGNQRTSHALAMAIWCCVFAIIMALAGLVALLMLLCGAGWWSLGFYVLASFMANDLAGRAAWPRHQA